ETKKGEDYEVEEIPADLADKAAEYREKLVEAAAEADDELMEKYLGGEELTEDEIKSAIRKLTIAREAFPVLAGSAFKNKGVQPIHDAWLDYLPTQHDVPPDEGTQPDGMPGRRPSSVDGPFSALVSKVAVHPFYGELTYIRVYPGKVASGTQVIYATKDRKER